jgi:hypothetical protein
MGRDGGGIAQVPQVWQLHSLQYYWRRSPLTDATTIGWDLGRDTRKE